MQVRQRVPGLRNGRSDDLAADLVGRRPNSSQRAATGRSVLRDIGQSGKFRLAHAPRAGCWRALAGGSRRPVSGIGAIFLVAILALAIVPARASDFSPTGMTASTRGLLYRVTVFSDDPNSIHDPRHPQPQTGADKMFAPIGLIWTDRPQPDQGAAATSHRHMGTAFLVSPCYVLSAYHVVLGYRVGSRKGKEAEQNASATFSTGGKTSRAVPVRYGRFAISSGQDWALLRLEPDTGHRCLGEDPNIGWVRLAPLAPAMAPKQSLSVAGYPADKSSASLWRQDTCHVFERSSNIANDGLWTTDCATRPRASGSPLFFIKDGVLNVVAIMSGHLGNDTDNRILPQWNPKRTNLALDISKIIASDPDFLQLIKADIDRSRRPNPAQMR